MKNDLESIRLLMKEGRGAVGFIPITAVETAYNASRLVICRADKRILGYLLFGPVREGKDTTVYQLCVTKNERRRGVGQRLVRSLLSNVRNGGGLGVRLRCAADLPANRFWRSLGFRVKRTVVSRSTKRKIRIYRFPIASNPSEET